MCKINTSVPERDIRVNLNINSIEYYLYKNLIHLEIFFLKIAFIYLFTMLIELFD